MTLTVKIFWPLALLTVLSTHGCKPHAGRKAAQEHVLMHTSFEELDGWLPAEQANLSTEKTHTGRFSIMVDPAHPYSITYHGLWGKLSPNHRPRRVTLRAWVWLPGAEGDARFVVAVSSPSDPDHPIFNKNVFLTDPGVFNKWTQISRDLDLPENLSSNMQIVIYLWNGASSVPVYADDLQLTELW